MTDALRYAQKAAADMENWYGVKPRVNRHAQLVVTQEQLTRLENIIGPLYPTDSVVPSSITAALAGVPIILEAGENHIQLIHPDPATQARARALQRRTRVRKAFRVILTLTALAVAVVAAGRIEADAALLEKVLLAIAACGLLVLVYVANGRKA